MESTVMKELFRVNNNKQCITIHYNTIYIVYSLGFFIQQSCSTRPKGQNVGSGGRRLFQYRLEGGMVSHGNHVLVRIHGRHPLRKGCVPCPARVFRRVLRTPFSRRIVGGNVVVADDARPVDSCDLSFLDVRSQDGF
mmetsp:Transcript_5377/g.8468  ORF Transcript_5377/g.8468 Transcript_5377/m.8468 type:complete len:137 (-) Transcript_5377:559-969(-)